MLTVTMDVNKLILFMSTVSFCVIERSYLCNAVSFTLDEYLGVWYNIRFVSPIPFGNDNSFGCSRFNVTRNLNDTHTFIQEDDAAGDSEPSVTIGKVENSLLYMPSGKHGYAAYEVRKFNEGNELLFTPILGLSYDFLISRTPNISESTSRIFRQLAEDIGGYIVSYQHQNCSYHYEN